MPVVLVMLGKWLIGPVGRWLLVAAAVAFITWRFYEAAWHDGFAARDTQAREQIAKLEQRMAERLRQNEGLTDDEVDCALKRLRNPKAECEK